MQGTVYGKHTIIKMPLIFMVQHIRCLHECPLIEWSEQPELDIIILIVADGKTEAQMLSIKNWPNGNM